MVQSLIELYDKAMGIINGIANSPFGQAVAGALSQVGNFLGIGNEEGKLTTTGGQEGGIAGTIGASIAESKAQRSINNNNVSVAPANITVAPAPVTFSLDGDVLFSNVKRKMQDENNQQ